MSTDVPLILFWSIALLALVHHVERPSLAAGLVMGVAIGLGLTLIHLISIPVTNTSVNPARSTGPALIVGDWALAQLWMFWVAPIFGALIAGYVYRWLGSSK